MTQPSTNNIHLNITYIRFHSNFPGANELTNPCWQDQNKPGGIHRRRKWKSHDFSYSSEWVIATFTTVSNGMSSVVARFNGISKFFHWFSACVEVDLEDFYTTASGTPILKCGIYSLRLVNTMAGDALAPCVANPSLILFPLSSHGIHH